jgi:hypothetical protein
VFFEIIKLSNEKQKYKEEKSLADFAPEAFPYPGTE